MSDPFKENHKVKFNFKREELKYELPMREIVRDVVAQPRTAKYRVGPPPELFARSLMRKDEFWE